MTELDFTQFPVLVVDDEQDNLDAFRFVFRKSFALHYAQGGADALAMLETLDPAVIVSDQRMPGMSGIDLLRRALERRPDAIGVLLTAYTDMPVLLEAINSGAVYRYVQKPWDSKELAVILRQSIERFHTLRENQRLKDQLGRYAGYLEAEHHDPIDFGELSAESSAMRGAVRQLETLAPGGTPVLVAGEPGTEKALFARALHVGSARESQPFVVVNCPSFSEVLLERELFGWEKGAFEGALSARAGRFELAHRGTLVLEELRDVSSSVAAQLERWLDQGKTRRLGSATDSRADVRLVATTSEPAPAFEKRSALARRIASATLTVPPLRDRFDDLPGMCDRLVVKCATRQGRPARSFSPEARAKLLVYEWPGNVLELSNVVERAVLLCNRPVIGPAFVALRDQGAPFVEAPTPSDASSIDLPGQLDHMERRELCAALERCHGNKAEVARMLGMQRTTLYYRLKRLGIEV
ncbi:MAG TPA: sigma-54 dependent transcriptional regulator [Polyangiaceae bacterium]|nr:sigma-54 dependent transcriptional regulator [Polyangiaceae bacterium]